MMEQRYKALDNSLEQTRSAALDINAVPASMADGLLITDKNDTIILINKAAEQLFKTRATDLINTSLQGLLTKHALNAINLSKIGNRNDVRRFAVELPAGTHKTILILQATSLPVYDTSGAALEGAVILFHDVTQEREFKRLKTEFASAAAHELRTPLTSIRGFSELLLEQNFSPEEQKKFLLYINQQSKQLTHIINSLIDALCLDSSQDQPVSFASKNPEPP
jgi:signal transduction histidine kinase